MQPQGVSGHEPQLSLENQPAPPLFGEVEKSWVSDWVKGVSRLEKGVRSVFDLVLSNPEIVREVGPNQPPEQRHEFDSRINVDVRHLGGWWL